MTFLKGGTAHTSLLVSLGLVCAMLLPSTASAAGHDGIEEAEADIRAFFTEFGVSGTVQDDLIAEYQNGELWDSLSGAVPVSEATSHTSAYAQTVSTYADGSISVTRVEEPAFVASGAVGPLGVTGCSAWIDGPRQHRDGCKIDMWVGPTAMSFYADYTFVDYDYDYIRSIYSQSHSIACAASVTQLEFKIVKKYENSAGPADARYGISAQFCGFPYAVTSYLRLRVGSAVGGGVSDYW